VLGLLRRAADWSDLEGTERRLQELLAAERSDSGRAEILTQLARVEALRGRFEAGERLVQEAESFAGTSPAALARIALERGRLLRSSGRPEEALPLFESAFETALAGGEDFLAGDAAHMAALAAPERDEHHAWTQRGVELARASESASYWLGPLFNNLGWEYFEAGEYDQALDAFDQALEARERDPERPYEIEIARYAVAKALRALGRPHEAATLLEQTVASTQSVGRPDGWFHEELALAYGDLGRDAEAAEHARLALPLLETGDPAFAEEDDRRERLLTLVTRGP
jgi:tetratricopeptide (TPR) repeat protein